MEEEVTRKRARVRDATKVLGPAVSHVGAYNALARELVRIESAIWNAVDRCRTENGVLRSTTIALLLETTVSPYPPPKNDRSEAEVSYLVHTMSPETVNQTGPEHRTKSDMLDELLGICERLTEPEALKHSIFPIPTECMSI